MAKKREFETELPELPKITPIDESIHILEETVAVLQLKIAELKARQKPYYGKSEPCIHPITGRIGTGPSKRMSPARRAAQKRRAKAVGPGGS